MFDPLMALEKKRIEAEGLLKALERLHRTPLFSQNKQPLEQAIAAYRAHLKQTPKLTSFRRLLN